MLSDNVFLSDEFRDVLEEYRATVGSPRTFDEYSSYINILCNFLKCDFLAIDEADADRYFSYLKGKMGEKKISARTFCARLSCYRSVSSFIETEHEELEFKNPFTKIIRPDTKTDIDPSAIPTLDELDAVMSAAKKDSAMAYIIMALASRMCLSSTSVLRLKKSSVLKEGEKVYLRVDASSSAGRNARYCVVPDDLVEPLLNYVASVPMYAEGHLFYNRRQRPLRMRNLASLVKSIVKESGVGKNYTMKDLRSRGVLELVNSGVNVSDIQEYAGIGPNRMADFLNSRAYIETDCPPNLVNYKLAGSSE